MTREQYERWKDFSLRMARHFLLERAAHRELEKSVGRSLPLETATVDRDWWDSRGEFPRAPTDAD